MELTNEFEVAVPVAEAWAVLTDVERIAPCLPGAELKEIEGDEYRGIVKVKVGPITASYRGAAHFKEMDEVAHRAVLEAEGRETRGQGNASALITATLSASDVGTKVQVNTELSITGKVAQFGRGVLADVSGKLLDQFVHNLETMVLAPAASAATNEPAEPASKTPEAKAPAARAKAEPKPKAKSQAAASSDGAGHVDEVEAKPETAPPTVRQIQSAPAEPVDLVGIAGPSLARRVLPFASIAGAFFLVRIIVYALRRRRS